MNNTTEIKLSDFIKENKITMSVNKRDVNPFMNDSKFPMDHYRVCLQVITEGSHRQYTTYFSKGMGHNGAEPTTEEVLDCLASDSAGIENEGSFENWADGYGYEQDQKARRIYQACCRVSEKLIRLLGQDLYNTLLWNTERE